MRDERSDHVMHEDEWRRLVTAYQSTYFDVFTDYVPDSPTIPLVQAELSVLVEVLRELVIEVRRLRKRLESNHEPS
jgi:hypothetical protein